MLNPINMNNEDSYQEVVFELNTQYIIQYTDCEYIEHSMSQVDTLRSNKLLTHEYVFSL